MANDKSEFEQNLRKWAITDNKIRTSNTELKDLRKQRETLSSSICTFMKTNGMENKKISTGDSIITFCEKKETSSLTFGYVEKCLGEIIADKDNVAYIIKYLKENREVKKSNDLRRVFHNTSGYETDE